MLKTTDRYILKKILFPFGLFIPVVSFLAVVNEIREDASTLPMQVIGLYDLVHIGLLFFPTLFVFIAPLAYLFSVIWALGGMYQSNELLAMKAGGVSSKRILAAPIMMGLVLSIVCLIVQNTVQIWAVGRMEELIVYELPQKLSLEKLPPNELHDYGNGDWKVIFEKASGPTIYSVDIVVESEGVRTIYSAASATIDRSDTGDFLVLEDVRMMRDKSFFNQMEKMRLLTPSLTPNKKQPKSRYAMSFGELFEQDRILSAQLNTPDKEYASGLLLAIRREIAERALTPITTLLFGFFGCTAAIVFSKQGKSHIFAVTLSIIVVYFILGNVAPVRSLGPLSEIIFRYSIPSLFLLIISLYLFFTCDRIKQVQ